MNGRVAAVLAFALLAPSVRPSVRAQSPSEPAARPVVLHLTDATIEQALRAIAATGAVRLSYSSDLLPTTVRVTIDRQFATPDSALREVLRGTNLGMVTIGTGHIVILRAPLVAATSDGAPNGNGGGHVGVERQMAPQVMDRVIVMGTPVAGAPERELTTAVNVVSANRISGARPRAMSDLFRAMIPGVVAWDLGASGPIAQVGSVRGSSSFSANYLKTYLDGIELASPYMLFAIDPTIVDQIEVIQGPQGSAMYGSDAISGVAHVITNKGMLGSGWRPSVDARAAAGVVETEYAASRASTQHHSLIARAGGSLVSYGVAGVVSDNGAYVTDGQARSSTGLATTRALAGPVLLEGTARATRIAFGTPVSPPLARALGTRAEPLIARATAGQVIDEHTLGATAIYEPVDGWRHTAVVGYDRNFGALLPQRNPAAVSDILLGASEEDARRASARYSMSLRLVPSASLSSTFTFGVEHSRLERERSGPASIIGPSTPVATRGTALYVDSVNNTGWFGQWKVDVKRALYLAAGVRGERNSSFGEGYGTAWSPMFGAGYVVGGASMTTKFRAAYGKGIRPPPPSARRAFTTTQYRQIANPVLAPESQAGVEGGIDFAVGDRVAVSATVFDQRVEGLIQHVIPNPRTSPRTVQQQNVGRISNRGSEGQATVRMGLLDLQIGVATVASQVDALSNAYSGDLRVGDRLPEVPSWSGHGAISLHLGPVRATGGASVVGPWTGYDWVSYYSALAQGADVPSSIRSYWMEYSSIARPYVMLSVDRASGLEWFGRIDNLTNQQREARDNLQVTAGRTTSMGLAVRF